MKHYLLKLTVCGIKNIEKPVEISFYKKTINNDFEPDKYKIKAIYGENGSGKTAIITAVKVLQNLILNSNYLGDFDTQRSLYEIVNRKTKSGFIECEFISQNRNDSFICSYRISFEISKDNRFYITAEKLDYKMGKYSKNRWIPIFAVRNGVLDKFENDSIFFDELEKKTFNLLKRQSLISSIFDVLSDVDMYDAFQKDFSCRIILYMMSFTASLDICLDDADDHYDYIYSHRMDYENLLCEENISDLGYNCKESGGGIFSFNRSDSLIPKYLFKIYEKQISRMSDFIKIFKPELEGIVIEKKEYDENQYKCNIKMIYDGYSIDREFESRGIKRIMNIFEYLDQASRGDIVFIDELDSNINDVYLDKLIEYFKYYGKGQLCFTAHNLSPMRVLRDSKNAIDFISGINTVHTWTRQGNMNPENAYRDGFIEDSPFNVDASDFLGILGDCDA